MADENQNQNQNASYPYLLDGSGLSVDIDRSPEAHQSNDLGHSPVQGQNHGQMSPPDSVSATPSAFMYSFAHASQQPYPPQLQQGSPTADLNQPQTLTLDPAQLRVPSVGPSRVLTRRQARMASSHPYTNASQENQRQQGQQLNEGFGMFGASANSQRPQTPGNFHPGAQLVDGRIALPDLNIGQITIPNAPAMSPQHPSTPASVTSSNFSHYGFAQYASNGHSRSGSSSTHPRSASPAASVVSAATSLSSGSDPKSKRSRPPASNGSTGCLSMASFGAIPADIGTVKPKRRLQNRQRKEICQYFNEHPNSRQEDIAARWGVERSTVSKILKHRNRWLAVPDGDDQVIAKHRPPKFAQIENRMQPWLHEMRESGTPITDAMIREKAREFAREMCIPEDKFKASAGWVENYKHRNNIKKGIWIGKPSPGLYETDDCDKEDTRPFLHDLIEERRREEALKGAQERVECGGEGLDSGIDIPGLGLSASSVALSSWAPLGLSFGDNDSTNTLGLDTNHVSKMNPVVAPRDDARNSPNEKMSTAFSTGDDSQQRGLSDERGGWVSNGNGVTNSGIPAPSPVSAQEAGSAIETVLRFLQTQKPEFIDQQVLNVFTDVRHLIWATSASAANRALQAANVGAMNNATSTGINATRGAVPSSVGSESVVAQAA